MLKEYKKGDSYQFINYDDTEILKRYLIDYNCHGFIYHWCNKKTFEKGYFNMDIQYGHWLELYRIFKYYL